MLWAMVIQIYIYKQSDAGTDAYNVSSLISPLSSSTSTSNAPTNSSQGDPVPINVWAQTGSYVLLALSEIFASITSLEYAFTKAPKNMRSLVMAFSLFQTALASAIGEAFNPLSADPLLTANYGLSMGLAILGGTLFWLQFRGQDADEDKLNMLPTVRMFCSERPRLVTNILFFRDMSARSTRLRRLSADVAASLRRR